MKHIFIDDMKERDKYTSICGYFKIPLLVIDRTTQQKNNIVKKQTLISHHQTIGSNGHL